MKVLVVVAGLMLALDVQCQTRTEFLFTNKVATFTNLQGVNYKDAELIRATVKDVIFRTNGDYGTVSLTNLSPATIDQLGVPSEFLQNVRDVEKKRAEAAAKDRAALIAEQKQLAEGSNLVSMRVESFIGRPEFNATYGYVQRCTVLLPAGRTTLYVARLPDRVPAYYVQANSLEKSVTELNSGLEAGAAQLAERQELLDRRQWQIDRAAAVPPAYYYWPLTTNTPGYYYYDYYAQRNAVNLAQADLDYAKARLDGTRNQLGGLESQLTNAQAKLAEVKGDPSGAAVQVLLSRFLHNGSRIAVCAPENLTPAAQQAR